MRPLAVSLAVRHRARSDITGDMQNQGFAGQYDTEDRLVFDAEELQTKGVILREGGRVTVEDFNGLGQPKTFKLVNLVDASGPINRVWTVEEEPV